MSYKHYFKENSKKEKQLPAGADEPVINRFSDVKEVDQRRHEVLDLMLLGYQPEKIADLLNEKLANVKNDIESIIETGYEARDEDITEVRDEMMRFYRLAARESYSAFKESQGKIETKTIKYGEGGDVSGNGSRNIEEEKVKTEIQSGDSRHMKNVLEAVKQMGKVTGAQKHKEVEMKQNVQQNSVTILSPNRTKVPDDFNRWTKKPDDAEMPDHDKEIDTENM